MLDSVGLKDVAIDDVFWRPKQEVNRNAAVPNQWRECERTGRIDNLRIVAGLKQGEVSHHLAPDSDVSKWAEAVSFDLNAEPGTTAFNKDGQDIQDAGTSGQRRGPDLRASRPRSCPSCASLLNAVPFPVRAELDELVSLFAEAQDETGYIDTSFQLDRKSWWTNLTDCHELYCGGHLIQAGVAHHRATGETGLLDVATKWADYVDSLFGPGKRPGTGGHPEVEMALVELYRETGEKRYLDLASYFVEMRGQTPPVLNGSSYVQDHLPIREQTTPAGHAVRQLYLASGVTDVYAETGDSRLLDAMKALWENLTQRMMYVTGGAGARYEGEAFGMDYELPNRVAYAETCAAIASAMWSWRMLQVTAEARYADEMERALYNGALPGVSLDGLSYFYTNGLEHDGGPDIATSHRGSNRRTSAHFDSVPCCPPNLARTIAGLGGYVYGKDDAGIYVHLYVGGRARIDLDGNAVEISQKTRYPWDGKVEITVNPSRDTKFDLHLRVPGWAGSAQVTVNGENPGIELTPGAYAALSRTWSAGDKVTLDIPMPVVRLVSHPRVSGNTGCVALRRGPLVYCIESVDFQGDHPDVDLFSIALPDASELEARYEEDLLGGVVTLRGEAVSRPIQAALNAPLSGDAGGEKKVAFTAIPCYAWANREPGAMRVWIPR